MDICRRFQLNYVLIDFENVQPKNMSILNDDHFRIRLFLGATQSRLDVEIVEAMHNSGPTRAEYIRVLQTGKNALDFHITYYLGKLVAQNPQAYFHIISKDKGFDPLLAHLNTQGVHARRHLSLADIPIIGVSENAELAEKTKAVLKNLKARGGARPRKTVTLKNTLKNMFKDEMDDEEVSRIFRRLVESKRIKMDKDQITYNL